MLTELRTLTNELQEVQSHAEGLIKVTPFKDPNNKWIVRSALQKAVRRGDLDTAVLCAGLMLADNQFYFWRSMSIIMVEDIGPTDPDLSYLSTAMMTAPPQVKAAIREKDVAEVLLKRAIEGSKTRVCCEMSFGADILATKSDYTAIAERGSEALIDELYNLEEGMTLGTYTDAYMIMTVLAGKNPSKIKVKVEDAVLKKLFEDMLPLKQARMAWIGYKNPIDSMHLSWLPSCLMLTDATPVNDDIPEEPGTVKGLPSSSFDTHTMQGKMALKAFYTSLRKDYPVINQIEESKAAKALGAVVFVVEGVLETLRLTSPLLTEAKEFQDTTFMKHSGVPESHVEEIKDIVSSELERLHSKRVWAVTIR